jgi:hypothetical protein
MDHSDDRQCTRRSVLGMAATAFAAGVGLTACGGRATTTRATSSAAPPDERRPIARDAYVFGYPLVLMDVTRAEGAALNQFAHAALLPTPLDRQVVRVNVDTLYSQAWLDLRSEPMVLSVPAMSGDRYWLMQLLDAWTNTVHNPSSVRPGAASGQTSCTYLITGPGWTGRVPWGMTRLAMPTPMAWLLGRIQVRGPHDVARVRRIQQQLRLSPLSEWTRGPHRTVLAASWPAMVEPPPKTVADMDGTAFFTRLNALLVDNPPAPADQPAMQRFAQLGIGAGQDANQLPADLLDEAVAEGKRQIADYLDPQTQRRNGWMFATNIGAYGTDYLLRANVALRGLGANLPEDAVYPTTVGMADTHGARKQFRLHFPPGSRPPVDAFWSITAYDSAGYLVDNPDEIYAVGHDRPVRSNPDGSIDILVQHDKPEPALAAGNWLPIPPAGPFSLTMRLYAPRPQALDGRWQPPPLAAVQT